MIKTGDLITTAQAAKMLGKSVRTIHRMAQSGALPGVKLGPGTCSWVFTRDAVDEAVKDPA